jgi:hypothetical protein
VTKIPTALIAEYMALATHLHEDSPRADYVRVNQLAWQLVMDLPADVYRTVTRGLTSITIQGRLEAISKLREAAGAREPLPAEEILWHAPGIGKPKAN